MQSSLFISSETEVMSAKASICLTAFYGIFARILFTSSAEKARIVCVRMLTSELTLKAHVVIASSFGASTMSTASYVPKVQ